MRQLFLARQAQTTNFPLGLEVDKAEGMYLYTPEGKKILDLIAGISVCNIGHRHPSVLRAISAQMDKYMHLMVYGEYIQSPQVKLAQALHKVLHPTLDNVYFVNSGSEAIEGALKLAKRYTGKTDIVACERSYHGSSHGALSIIGDESFRQNYRPLLPGITHIPFNDISALDAIGPNTAAIVVECVQSESGYIVADEDFLLEARSRCTKYGALLILDEVQTGFGRTGQLFAFHGIKDFVPDIIVLAKGMGGGLPIGAFIAPRKIMAALKENPILGHITTFGGNPVSCAASMAVLEELLKTNMVCKVPEKEIRFRKGLQHPEILEVQGKGLMLSFRLSSFEKVQKTMHLCLEKGLVTDWFLFEQNALRVAPPLIITEDEIDWSCKIIREALDAIRK
ncbi:MAG: aspartate aminotransferase family protein [Cryomorphaceae bacterium]|nr:aspartate aminotransferase family protein [Cryomorphaceae bacterium]